jgi:hypothetical protein
MFVDLSNQTIPFSAQQSTNIFHPFYVSVTEINHNAKDKTLEISCKIFVDDMEEVLKKNYNKPVDLGNGKQQQQNDQFISDYIGKRFAMIIDGKAVKFTYIGFEKDKESVYCYFEVPNINGLKKVDLTNALLQDLNKEQINIMHVVINGNRKSYKLDYPKTQASFVF